MGSDLRKPGRRIGRSTPMCGATRGWLGPRVENAPVRVVSGTTDTRRESGRPHWAGHVSPLERPGGTAPATELEEPVFALVSEMLMTVAMI